MADYTPPVSSGSAGPFTGYFEDTFEYLAAGGLQTFAPTHPPKVLIGIYAKNLAGVVASPSPGAAVSVVQLADIGAQGSTQLFAAIDGADIAIQAVGFGAVNYNVVCRYLY
jgi:hypothetical protein